MIPTYTSYDLAMDVCGKKYVLPFTANDEEVVEKTIKLFSDSTFYEKELYEQHTKKPSISHEGNKVIVNCLYEGYSGYYSFSIILDVFRFIGDDQDQYTGKHLAALTVEHRYSELLDELIDINCIPGIISSTNLKQAR